MFEELSKYNYCYAIELKVKLIILIKEPITVYSDLFYLYYGSRCNEWGEYIQYF